MILEIWLLTGGIMLCIALSAFFSGSESGMMLSDPLKLQHRADRGDGRSRMILALKSKTDIVLGTVLVGNNIVNVTAAVLANKLLEHWFSPYIANLVTTFALTAVMLVTTEILPKLIFQSRPEELSRHVAPYLYFSSWLLRPVLVIVNGISRGIAFLFGGHRKERFSLTREDIALLADVGIEQGAINARSYALLGSVLAFTVTTAREIMTPLVDLAAIDDEASVENAIRLIEKSGFSRIPVYHEQAHTMVGYVSAFDLKQSRRSEGLGEYLRAAEYVPESKCIDGLLIEMRQKRLPLVFVVDEWGGTAGIVTHEDIAEHVVGQILDKGEKAELEMQQVTPGEYLADGWTDVDKVQKVLGVRIEKKGFETLGGFLGHLLQRIPVRDDSAVFEGYRFIVEEAENTRVVRVRIRRINAKKKNGQPARKVAGPETTAAAPVESGRRKTRQTQNGKKHDENAK